MPKYKNLKSHDVYPTGPNGERIRIRKGQKIIDLPEWYDRYTGPGGFLERISNKSSNDDNDNGNDVDALIIRNVNEQSNNQRQINRQHIPKRRVTTLSPSNVGSSKKRIPITKRVVHKKGKRILGKSDNGEFSNDVNNLLSCTRYSISNDIGVGILSYNRLSSLRRLINSIDKYTDISKTTIFISDDNSDDNDLLHYLEMLSNSKRYVVLNNSKRLGIAGNSNRLLTCLSRFDNKLLLNDDVEILQHGWDRFYFDAASKTGIKHFCFRQPGVYGAKNGSTIDKKGIKLSRVDDKPHGAIMSFNYEVFDKIGYFDQKFGFYGMEHVDWSTRVYRSGIQERGYYDVIGSSKFFKIHSDKSAVPDRVSNFHAARDKYMGDAEPVYKDINDSVSVPSLTYVVPCRSHDRSEAIKTVINGIKAQKFPNIEIIVSEEDESSKISMTSSINHVFTKGLPSPLFNKSVAFNSAVHVAKHDKLILHDADMLSDDNYTSEIYNVLDEYESCHLCSRVFYLSSGDTDNVNSLKKIDSVNKVGRVVDYFEGGSLACTKSAYWKVGGFAEVFVGYGCEDCDFFSRISNGSNFLDDRKFVLIHLFHGRTPGWMKQHEKNRVIEARLFSKPVEKRIEDQVEIIKNSRYKDNLL